MGRRLPDAKVNVLSVAITTLSSVKRDEAQGAPVREAPGANLIFAPELQRWA